MSGLPKMPETRQRSGVWLKASEHPQLVTVCSRVAWFMGHWSAHRRCSVRCLGELCPVCASGDPARPFTYVAVRDEAQEIRFLEISARCRRIAEELEGSDRGGVGAVLMVRKEGKARNSPIVMAFSGEEEVPEFDPWPFVNTLGQELRPMAKRIGDQGADQANPDVRSEHGRARAM